ncbi:MULTISPECIES: DUF305 domain-containing protein [unclassified Microbacterium]|jgi:uncharacterized protein (DUF305 family)|uniref:DUF305 domain-containing protein n=1 Tax=unclassified Microbacterium TaxID=2609290 RepID=UPI000C2C8AC3|nr:MULTISPECIES: DUF305 domain-containing protein [unclassified Microbacterium]MDO8381808.1 DUF305 domain-containing protein [Microbacterium sp.]
MNNRAAATAAITLTALLALAGCAGTTGAGGMDNMPGMGSSASASTAADVNDADMQFTMMMIPHHEQAVEMADMILAKENIDERVITLAEQIKAAQGPEIELMESWLDEWGTPMGDMGGMDHGGMMSETDMQALEDATGAEASRLFLEQMIVHHEGAIEMAQSEVDNGGNADVLALAEAIIASQTTEITTMEDILATL